MEDERHSSLEKHLSHFIWKGSKGLLKVLLWEGVRDRTELQHIDPNSYGHNSVSPELLNRGPGGPASLGHVPHSSIFSPTDLNFNCSIGCPESPLCWVLVFSTASYLRLTDFLSSPGLYNCSTSTFFLWASQIELIQTVHCQGYILIFLGWMHLLFTQVHFLFWQLSRGQYVTVALELWKAKLVLLEG